MFEYIIDVDIKQRRAEYTSLSDAKRHLVRVSDTERGFNGGGLVFVHFAYDRQHFTVYSHFGHFEPEVVLRNAVVCFTDVEKCEDGFL